MQPYKHPYLWCYMFIAGLWPRGMSPGVSLADGPCPLDPIDNTLVLMMQKMLTVK